MKNPPSVKLTKQNNRLVWIDALKGFGILTVIYMHNIFPETPSAYAAPLRVIAAFHMSLFFIASGFFFNYLADAPFLPFLRKKARALLFPYILWGCMIGSAVNAGRLWMQGDHNLPLLSDLKAALLGSTAYAASWFLMALFTVYLLQYVIRKTALKLLKKEWCVLLFQFAVNAALALAGYLVSCAASHYYRIRIACMLSLFFFAGAMLRRLWDSTEKAVFTSPITGAVILAVGIAVSLINAKVSLLNYHFANPALTVTAALCINYGLFCLFRAFLDNPANAVVRCLAYFGKNTIIVLLTHKGVILAFRVLEKLLGLGEHSLNPVLGFALAVIIEIPIVFICRKYFAFWFGYSTEKEKKHGKRNRQKEIL